MTAAHDAEIVEKPKVELPPERDLYACKYYDSINESWDSTIGFRSDADAIADAKRDDAVESSIRVYRLGPPKPRMTEAEVKDTILQIAAFIAGDSHRECAVSAMQFLARRLGVLEQPS